MALKQSTNYREIAEKLLDKYTIAFGHILLDEVLFLVEDEKSPKNKYADTRVIRPPYTFFSDYKFIITFYENNIMSMSDEQKILLVYHELMHIDVSFTKLVSHDLMDFRVIVSKFGACWDIDPNLVNILEDEDKDLDVDRDEDPEDFMN